MTKQNKLQGDPLNRARSLAERIDDPPGLRNVRELGCQLTCRSTDQKIYWPSPIFSRLALDLPDWLKWLPTLDKLRKSCGVSIVEPETLPGQPSSENLRSGADRALDDGLSIQPLFVDEPIRFEPLMHAEQIELQFIPSAMQSAHGAVASSYSPERWAPTLPSDLTDIEKMSKRIDLIRSSSDQSTVVVGGAIPAGRIYEDVRFLVDCGVDYVCVLSHVVAGVTPPKTWTFQPIDYVIEQALGAIEKSGARGVTLLVCSPIENVQDALRLLASGVDAFSIDSWLIAQNANAPSNKSSDDFGAFMGSYARQATVTANDGLVAAAESLLQDLNALRRIYEI